ncbi:MAG: GGDEF domain-containing protein, partial [Acidobacteriota bacterium]
MSPPAASHPARRELAHRALLWSLALLLLAISCWCLLLLVRSWSLRQDLDLHHGWLDDLRRARLELQQSAEELTARNRWAFLAGLGQSLDQRGIRGDASPALQQTTLRLQSSLDALRDVLLTSDLETTTPPRAERVADAAFTVSKAIAALENQVQGRVESLYRRLDGHWRALNSLVGICLLLCASNLGLLHLAHRRRGQLEAARDRALQLASHDALTGLWNREAILRMLRRELA